MLEIEFEQNSIVFHLKLKPSNTVRILAKISFIIETFTKRTKYNTNEGVLYFKVQ